MKQTNLGALLVAAMTAISLTAGGGGMAASTLEPVPNTGSAGTGGAAAVDLWSAWPVATAEAWEPLPMVRQDILDQGYRPGGEGCQYPQTICVDSINGSFLLYGTDVGGIYRSLDGGHTFQPCDMGFSAVGSCGFAMDPKNLDRCLAVGDNSGNDYYQYDGIYLSTDRGASWKQALPKLNKGNEKAREQIAYDPTSFDAQLGYCKIAYWSEEANAKEPGGRLYKTSDGGETWAEVAQGPAYGGGKVDSLLKIHPATGAVYIANDSGFYKSTDGGVTFTRKMAGDFTSLDVVATQPEDVWLGTATTLYHSTDAGNTFQAIPSLGIGGFYRVKVSPADPKRMICQSPKNGERYYSTDGGVRWMGSEKKMERSWIPPEILYNDRARLVVWHPTNPELAWGIGPGDIMSKTLDHGVNFLWNNNGNNGIMMGGLFNFNTQNPNILYFGSQDYNGALTTNGGRTWEFINLSKDNGKDGDAWGWVYGGYAASDRIMYGGNRAYQENNYNLWITFDGGRTTMQKVTNLTGAQVSYGDPTDPDVLFCWSYRSPDRGQTWTQMTGCDGVFTSNAARTHELYGRNGKDIVRSRDKGLTWQVAASLPGEVRDVAFDGKHDRIYTACNNRVFECDGPAYTPTDINDRLPHDQHNDAFLASSVAVDPRDTNIVYAAANGTGLFFQRNNGVARSVDGGVTWERLTCNPAHGMTGGQMASAIRVNPANRYAYVGTDCYGVWRIHPPLPKPAATLSK